MEWSLVLAAFGILHSIEPDPAASDQVFIELDPFQRDAALHQLRLWKQGAPYSVPGEDPTGGSGWSPAFLVPSLLILFHLRMLLSEARNIQLLARGNLSGDALAAGEWWRPVTALLLHRDIQHLIFNFLPLALLVPTIASRLGSGPAWLWLLVSSAGGNAVAALLRDGRIRSIGASTLVFTALGFAALLKSADGNRGRVWLAAIGAGLVFISMSSGGNVDIAGHIFGFGAGILMGAVWSLLLARNPDGPGRVARLLSGFGAGISLIVVLVRFLSWF